MSETATMLAAMRAYGPRGAALRGSYFRANNPVIGTGLAMAIQTSLLETNALGLFVNGYPTLGAGGAGAGIVLVPDFIRLVCTVAPASGTDSHFAFALDNGNRYTSGGTLLVPGRTRSSLLTPPNPSSLIKPYFGNLTLTAASATRAIQSHGTVKYQAAPDITVGDEIIFVFGVMEQAAAPLSGAGVQRIYIPCGPLGVDPGDSLALHFWTVANAVTAPSFEVEAGWSEEPPTALVVPT